MSNDSSQTSLNFSSIYFYSIAEENFTSKKKNCIILLLNNFGTQINEGQDKKSKIQLLEIYMAK